MSTEGCLHPLTFFHKKWCRNVTDKFISSPFSFWFRDPPSLTVTDYDAYLQAVNHPISLRDIATRLKDDAYIYVEEWESDMRRVFNNAISFNEPETEPYSFAIYLKAYFEKHYQPTPNSEEEEVLIQITKAYQKLCSHLDLIPEEIQKLHWVINKFSSTTKSQGEQIQLSEIETIDIPKDLSNMFR